MEIKVIGSGSSGNCYRISDGTTALLLEAGLPIKKIKQGCDFDLSGISGCLVTHEHGDHAKSVRDVMKSGVDVYMTRGTAEAANLDGYRLHRIVPMVSFKIGSLKVLPFEVHHDAAEPVGYLVDSQVTGERLLFMTDTYYTQFKFQSLTHIMIEANYSADEISDDPRAHRLRRSHMSIENCIELLKANDLSRCSEIWLIHLSSSNGDAEGFKRRVQEATGVPVFVA